MALTADTLTIEPGVYWLGDPCYAIPNNDWMTWLKAARYETRNTLDATLNGHRAIAFGTLYGDGCYEGSDGNNYPVDAGLIGLVPVALNANVRPDLAVKVTFTAPTVCEARANGDLVFGDITVHTGDSCTWCGGYDPACGPDCCVNGYYEDEEGDDDDNF